MMTTTSTADVIAPQVDQKIYTSCKAHGGAERVDVTEVNVKQVVTQIAIQFAEGGRNVSQVITLIANQIAVEDKDGRVKQFVTRLAKQQTAGNEGNVNQTINRVANQVVMGDSNNVVQVIVQAAKQADIRNAGQDHYRRRAERKTGA